MVIDGDVDMLRKKLLDLKAVVDHQTGLSIWPERQASLNEHLLANALRHLHAIITGSEETAKAAKLFYWEIDSEH